MKLYIHNYKLKILSLGLTGLFLLSLSLTTWDAVWGSVYLIFVIRIIHLDIKEMLISDLDVMIIAFMGFGYTVFDAIINGVSVINILFITSEIVINIIILMMLLILVAKAFRIIRKVDGIGEGDIKLIGASGAWLPIVNVLQAVGLAAFFALLTFGIWRPRSPGEPANIPMPFGAFLAPSIWLVWLILRTSSAS